MVIDPKTGTAIVSLPPLHGILNLYDHSENKDNSELLESIRNSSFYKESLKIVTNFNGKFYLNFLIYGEYSGVLPKRVFNVDTNNKNILNEKRVNHGYALHCRFHYDPMDMFSDSHYSLERNILVLLKSIKSNLEHSKSKLKVKNVDSKKDTLVFISPIYESSEFLSRVLIYPEMVIHSYRKKQKISKSS